MNFSLNRLKNVISRQVFLPRDIVRQLLGYCAPYRWHLVGAFLGTLLVSGSSGVALWLVEQVSSVMLNLSDLSEVNHLLALALASLIFLVVGVISFVQTYLTAYVGQRIATNLRQDVFAYVIGLSKAFHDRQKTGELMSRINQDIHIIQYGVARLAPRLLRTLFTPVVVVSYLFYLSWQLTVLAVFLMPVFAGFILHLGKKMRHSGHQVAQEIASLNSALQEILTNIYVVKCFAAETREVNRFKQQNENCFRASMREVLVSALQKPAAALFQMFCFLFVIWYGSWLRLSGEISVEEITAFFIGLGILVEACLALSSVHVDLQRALVSTERVFDLLSRPVTVQQQPDAVTLKNIQGSVRFSAVYFRYPDKKIDALQAIDFAIPAGQTVALVGPSGAGKTSLVNLIMRLYDPTQGRILIDGQDIRTVDLCSLREQIGVVPQELGLFAGTIQANIAYGKPDATDKEITRAAKLAHVHNFVSRLPRDYASQIGERGVHLSAGERQRIAIARVFLRNPRIIILDEATAYLDAESEELIQRSLERLLQDRTAFIIAHRLTTIRRADRIMVFDKGHLVEFGNHRELINRGGVYSGLHEKQFSALPATDS